MEAAVLAETERQQDAVVSRGGSASREMLPEPAAATAATASTLPTASEAIEGMEPAPPAPESDPAAVAAAAASAAGVPGLAGDALVESSAEFLGKLNGIVQVTSQCSSALRNAPSLVTNHGVRLVADHAEQGPGILTQSTLFLSPSVP